MAAPAAGEPTQRFAHEGKHLYLARKLTAGESVSDVIADLDAPVVAELTDEDMFDFTKYFPKTSGVSGDPTENYVEGADQSEVFDAQQVGSFAEQLTFELFMQDPDNNAYDYFTYGDVVVYVDIYAATDSSPADGDPCVVRVLEVHEPKPLPFATNEKQRFRMGSSNLQEPHYKSTVVGS